MRRVWTCRRRATLILSALAPTIMLSPVHKSLALGNMMPTVKYEDLSAAFDFVSFGAPMEHEAYISLDTGAIYWVSDAVEEEIPDDLETSDRYIAVPHKNDLDLGSRLALEFAAAELPDQYETIEGFFRRPGAYGRFKELLAAQRRLDNWYAFEAESAAKALKDWCLANGIEVTEDDSTPASGNGSGSLTAGFGVGCPWAWSPAQVRTGGGTGYFGGASLS